MSSSTALLPKQAKKDDHSIFLRVCHSPWVYVGQKSLSRIRGVLAAYMLVSFIVCLHYEKHYVGAGWMIPFDFANFAYLLQLIYEWTAFIWTHMHLHYPHHASRTQTIETRVQRFFSPPRTHPKTKNRALFSIFYTAAVVFPHVVTLVFWAGLVPKGYTVYPIREFFTHGSYRGFWIMSKYIINTLIALFEILVLSSIRRQTPVWAHIVGLAVLVDVYIAWMYIGRAILGRYAYQFFDPTIYDWEDILCTILAFNALPSFFFGVVYGLTGFREMATSKAEKKNSGYNRLPQ